MPADSVHSTPRSEKTSTSSPETKKKPRIFSLRLGHLRRRSSSHPDHNSEARSHSPPANTLPASRTSFAAPRSPDFLPKNGFFSPNLEKFESLSPPSHSTPTNANPQHPHPIGSPPTNVHPTPTPKSASLDRFPSLPSTPASLNVANPSVSAPNSPPTSDSDSDSDRSFGFNLHAEASASQESLRFSLLLNEAANDTPSFRASANYVDVMLSDFEQWLQQFADRVSAVVAQLGEVKQSVNDVIGLFMPGATHASLFAQDYTTLAFGRYTEAEQVFWTDLFVRAAKNAHEIVQMVKRLRQTVFVRYRHAQQRHAQTQRELDAASLDLFALPAHAERAAQREAAHRFARAQQRHWHAATRLAVTVAEIETECTISLLETLSQSYSGRCGSDLAGDVDSDPDFSGIADTDRLSIRVEMHRLHQAALKLRQTLPSLANELRARRRQLRAQLRQPKESPDLHGAWVRAELRAGEKKIVWAYMQHQMFGFLGLSANGTAVVESPKIVKTSARFEVLNDEERRFAFRVMNVDNEFVTVQAACALDFERWQRAFAPPADRPALSRSGSCQALAKPAHKLPLIKRNSSILSQNRLSKRSLNECLVEPPATASAPTPTAPAWSAMDLRPWNVAFALDGSSPGLPDSDLVVKRIDELRHDMQRTRGLKFDSTLTSRGSMDFDLRVPAVMPLPTSVQLEAVVANSFFRPEHTCNAITANLWGVTGQHRLNSVNLESLPRRNCFPAYPNNYASSLMVQDMDLRGMVAQLPHQFAMLPNEVMLTFVRAVQTGVPVRLYLTNHRLLVYGPWHGVVTISCYLLASVLDVETVHGVDSSWLRIYVQTDAANGVETAVLEYELFVDSAVLAKRKIDYVKENSRLASPQSAHDLLDALAVIAIEHGEQQRRHETQIAKAMREWPHPPPSSTNNNQPTITNPQTPSPTNQPTNSQTPSPTNQPTNSQQPAPPNHPAPPNQPTPTNTSLAAYILATPVGTGSTRGEEDALQIGSGMQTKLGEDTYPLSVDALFLVMFGAKSPVFAGEHAGFMPSECTVGRWYRRGRRLERRVKERYAGLGLEYENRYNVQRVDRRQSDLFIVTEKRAPWQVPRGDRFYALVKYVAYATAGGCHLQMWLRTVWLDEQRDTNAEKSVEQSMAVNIKSINLSTRRAAQQISSVNEARAMFGSVKPEKVLVTNSAHANSDMDAHLQPTRITKRVLALMFVQAYWRMSASFRRTLRRQAWHYVKVSVPQILALLLVLLSVLANCVLYQRYQTQYWQAELERSSLDATVTKLRLEPTQQCPLVRSVYAREIDDLLGANSPWPFTETNNSQRCAHKFAEIAQFSLTDGEFGTLYEFAPSVQRTLDQISDTRYAYALQRNELLTLLTMLNHQERDELQNVYRQWLLTESRMCAEARRALPLLQPNASEAITAYCLSCLTEAKQLL